MKRLILFLLCVCIGCHGQVTVERKVIVQEPVIPAPEPGLQAPTIETVIPDPVIPVLEPKWFEGGTLHAVTIARWQKGSYPDRLATAADLIIAYLETKGINKSEIDMKVLRREANRLVEEMTDNAGKEVFVKNRFGRQVSMGISGGFTPGAAWEYANSFLADHKSLLTDILK
jgi:hypothetical protein